MGLCGARGVGDPEQDAKSSEIEKQLQADKKASKTVHKLLLLGSGESGKTTIAKQMKILYLNGFDASEVAAFRHVIHSNVLVSMRNITRAAARLGFQVSEDNRCRAELISSDKSLTELNLTPQFADACKALWNDPAIKNTYERRSEFQLFDSAAYFFDALDRITDPNYHPTNLDILYARARTSGIVETVFTTSGNTFRLVDVGGQRSERKKWIHCFEGVVCLLFVVSLSEYDQNLIECEGVNRMHESVILFDEICKCQWFAPTPIILFLNKDDIFREKITKIDLKVCFPEYTGGCHYKPAARFIKDKFRALAVTQHKEIYPHFTTSTNTENIQFVFNAVQDIILRKVGSDAGII